MGFFSKFFKKNNNVQTVQIEYQELSNLFKFMDSLKKQDHYVAKSEYKEYLQNSEKIISYYEVLQSSGMLANYCKEHNISVKFVEEILRDYHHFDKIIDECNDEFVSKKLIEEKNYLDHILDEVDSKILLDEDQRKVILTDEDYSLVIAGAGAGKTTTVAAKVKYLVEKKNIDPSEILVVSFTNKAVQELKDKLNTELAIPCPVATFHSTGNAILRKQSADKLNIVDSSKLYYVLQDYFKQSVLKNESLVNNLILFFSSYFDAPYEGEDLNAFFNEIAKSNFSTMRSDLDEFKQEVIDSRTKKKVTIQSEMMRSFQEVEIANFLYLNGIDYEYEPIYKYDIQFAHKPYTPDFILHQSGKEIYLEHFGISQNGHNDRYSKGQLDNYKKAINDKILLHRKHGTKLIYTFSAYNDQRPLIEHLREQLIENGFNLIPRSNQEVMQKLISSEESRYIRRLISLICRFITNFKTNGYTVDEFNRMYHSTVNVRSRLFLNICNDCYLEYERYLKENNAVDFEDMINESARILREVREMKEKLDFKYIIVDEYQDISKQRFDLVTALSEVTDAKIIAVGDDWQSIYAFSGSDITLFTHFVEKMGYAKLLKIVNTYRNSQEVIDIAGNFIQKNKTQITKELKSPKSITDPVIIYTYDNKSSKIKNNNRSGNNYAMAHAVETALAQIVEYNKQENKPEKSSILLLGRFGFDGDKLEKSGLFEYTSRNGRIKSVKFPKLNITFMTAHSSKGLGYDNVIVVNGKNETYGFPSKIEDDPVLSFVIKGDRSIDYAEERRLFYVAMTRTKNRVYFIAPEQNPSEFLLEIKRDYKNVSLRGEWNESPVTNQALRKVCPICGYPMQFRYKNSYGLRLYLCTNEPEICGFMTNEPKAGKLSIMKCDQCRDGYLIVKPGKHSGYFLGCTNYKKDGTGCSNVINSNVYYEKYQLNQENVKQENKPEIVKNEKISNNKSVEKVIKYSIEKSNITGVLWKDYDLTETIDIIVQCLEKISEKYYYGITMLIDILHGEQTDKIRKNKFDKLKEYGKLGTMDYQDIKTIVEWMIEENYIHKTKHRNYPVLHPTYEGRHYSDTLTKRKLDNLKKKLEQ